MTKEEAEERYKALVIPSELECYWTEEAGLIKSNEAIQSYK